MSWRCLAAELLLSLIAGCGWQGPMLAQAPASPPVQLQKPKEDPAVQQAGATVKAPPGQVAVRMCVEVDGEPIFENELRQALVPYQPLLNATPEPERSIRLKEARERELTKLIDREVVLRDAFQRLKKNPTAERKLKEAAAKEFDKQIRNWKAEINKTPGLPQPIESDDDLKPILAHQGLTLSYLKRKSEREFMMREYLMNRVWAQVEVIGHKEVKQYYEEHPGEFQAEDKVKWLHIFLSNHNPEHPDPASTHRFAEEIVRQLKAGGDFIKLAERYDEGTSKFKHGEGTGERHGEIRPFEAESYLFGMSEGDVGPILETPTGYHIIKLASREYAGLMPFDEATQQTIRRKLQNVVMERESKRFVDELRRKATIRYFDVKP